RRAAGGRAAGAPAWPHGEAAMTRAAARPTWRAFVPAAIGVALAVIMAILPLLHTPPPRILPAPTYTPGSLARLSLCMVFAALALSYNMLLGSGGMLSFGHALYCGAGAYGLGIILEYSGVPLWPGVFIALIGGLVIAMVTGAVSMRV